MNNINTIKLTGEVIKSYTGNTKTFLTIKSQITNTRYGLFSASIKNNLVYDNLNNIIIKITGKLNTTKNNFGFYNTNILIDSYKILTNDK